MSVIVTFIRSNITKTVKEIDIKPVNKLWQQSRAAHCIKGSNKSKSIKCFGGALLSNLSRQDLPKNFGSTDLLSSNHVIIATVNQFTTTKEKRSNNLTATELKKAIEQLTDQFIEARELLDDARESVGTVYFSEDMDEARQAVITTLEQYENLLTQLSEDQKQEVRRTIGLKMEELKAQEQAIKDSLHDD